MKTFLRVFAVLIALFVVVGLFLDNQVKVERSIVIQASPAEIHALVDDLNQWPAWSPWTDLDPSIQTTIGKISQGVGASQSWKGESGSGSLTFTESSVDLGVTYQMIFDGDSSAYSATMTYVAENEGTKVTWRMSGAMEPIIIGNYFAQLMDSLVGGSFELGLQKLKLAAEGNH